MPIPSDFSSRSLAITFVDANRLIRIFRTPTGKQPSPVYYGRSALCRFDCPTSVIATSKYGVTYAAFELATCFAETVTREDNSRPLRYGGIAVSESGQISPRFVANLTATTMLRLADVTDLGLYQIGAEAGEFNSIDYHNATQPWSLEIFNRQEQVDGLLYRSRFLNGRTAVAIFERGGNRVSLGASQIIPLQQHAEYATVLTKLNVYLYP